MTATPNYAAAKIFSEEKLSTLRKALESIVPNDSVALTCGSFARRDASAQSDIDFFLISRGKAATGKPPPSWLADAHRAIKEIIPKTPAEGGAFAQHINRDGILRDFGGSKDSNATITRRMLYLLAGEWRSNEGEARARCAG